MKSEAGERTPKNGQIDFGAKFPEENALKPLVLGTSMDSHTQKLAPGNWTTKFLFDIQAVNAFFSIILQFGTQFVTWISHFGYMDFSYSGYLPC